MLENFKPMIRKSEEFSNGFLKINESFPVGNSTQKYLWIYCDICGSRHNSYEIFNGLWLCQKCRTLVNNVEKRITTVRCDICNNRLTFCKSKTEHWWECRKCKMITEKQKLK